VGLRRRSRASKIGSQGTERERVRQLGNEWAKERHRNRRERGEGALYNGAGGRESPPVVARQGGRVATWKHDGSD
jgi:hypothetical protein